MTGFLRWLIVVDLLTIQAPGAEDQGRGRETWKQGWSCLRFLYTSWSLWLLSHVIHKRILTFCFHLFRFFFLSYFFVLLQNLSPLLFAIFEVPRIAWGVGRGNASKVPYGQFEDSEFTFRWSELAALLRLSPVFFTWPRILRDKTFLLVGQIRSELDKHPISAWYK